MQQHVAFVAVLVSFVAPALGQEEPTRFAADRPVDCTHIRLDLTVDLDRKQVGGLATLDLVPLRDVRSVTLDARELDVTRVVDLETDSELDFANDGAELEVRLPAVVTAGDGMRFAIEYSTTDPTNGLHFFGPTEDAPDVPRVVWSQGESTENSYWFPCFDHPNERQTTELVVKTSQDFAVSSNGRLVAQLVDEAGMTTYHWLQDEPHPAYLVTLIVGEFQVERDTWRNVPVEYWVHPGYEGWVERTFERTKGMLDFFSDSIGVRYPWARYAQICCEGFGGGMENTSATTLGTRALQDERSILDSDSDGLIAHELAHQWFGDLVTCSDWAHIWLNEGFASYFEALWDEHHVGAEEFDYNMFRKGEGARRGGTRRPIVDRAYDSPDSMFDSRAYPKGAWVLHMIRRRLGDDLFWKVIHEYVQTHAYGSVETVDLRKSIEQLTGRSFERFFWDWTERPGHPDVELAYTWNAQERVARFALKQKQKESAFHFPLHVEVGFEDGRQPVSRTFAITEKEVTLYLPLDEAPSLVRIDPDQAVLMELDERKGRDLWRTQLLLDPSPAARIRAARHFAGSSAEMDVRLLAEALVAETHHGVQGELAQALGKVGGEIARDALIMGLALDAPAGRRACAQALSSFRDDEVAAAAVGRIAAEGDPSYQVESAALSAYATLGGDEALPVLEEALQRDSRFEVLRNAALNGLGRMSDESVPALLSEWSQPGKSRLVRPSALSALAAWTRHASVDDATWQAIVDTLAKGLRAEDRRVRSAAARALGSIAEPIRARAVLADLEALAESDPDRRVRGSAERSVEAIKKGEPAPEQLAELRDKLKEGENRDKAIAERLEKLEAMMTDG